jgi:hypothetical protein
MVENNNSEGIGIGGANRRRFLKAVGVLGVTGLAGCGGDGDDTVADTTTPTGTPTDTPGDGTADGGTPTRTPTRTPTPTSTPTPDPTYAVENEPGEHVDVVGPDGPVARYRCAFEEDRFDPTGLDPVSKAYLAVIDPATGSAISHDPSQGNDGHPHQRGIEVTWGCLTVDGEEHDFWHMDSGELIVHREFGGSLETFPAEQTIRSELEWITPDDEVVLQETREMTFVEPPPAEGSIVQIDVETTLEATDRAVELDFCHGFEDASDEPYGGVRFSAHSDVATSNSAEFHFPEDAFSDDDPGVLDIRNKSGMPWAITSFPLHGNEYFVQGMDHSDNAFDTRWSAYRSYGLFGTFFEETIDAGESLTAKCGFYVSRGAALRTSRSTRSTWIVREPIISLDQSNCGLPVVPSCSRLSV